MNLVKLEQIIQESAEKWPHSPAVIDEQGALTFSDLFLEINKLSNNLFTQGIRPGMGLAMSIKNGRDFFIGLFAGLACGATVMPLASHLRKLERQKLLNQIPVHAILNSSTSKQQETIFILEWLNPDLSIPCVKHAPDAALIRPTSGTTNESKGVVLSHQSVFERINIAQETFQLTTNDRVAWVLPMAYHFIVSLIMYLKNGVCTVCCDGLAKSIIENVNKHSCTLLYASPTHYKMLAADSSSSQLPTLKYAISTASDLERDVALSFFNRFNLPVTQVFGIIEVGLPIGNFKRALKRPESIGAALKGFKVKIVDDSNRDVACNTSGQLCVKGPGMFDAYLTPPKLRNDILIDGWFKTGDLASLDEHGMINIAGRAGSVIHVAGNKVFPKDVEEVLNMHPGVKLSRVFGETHHFMGQVPAAEVELNNSKTTLNSEEIRKFCSTKLSPFKIPQRIYVVDKIKLTGSGKILRH